MWLSRAIDAVEKKVKEKETHHARISELYKHVQIQEAIISDRDQRIFELNENKDWGQYVEIIPLLKKAEAFDFGQLHLEMGNNYYGHGFHNYAVPTITEEERSFYAEGVLPFPAPLCWFEFKLETKSGILVQVEDDGIRAQQIDVESWMRGGKIFFGIWGKIYWKDVMDNNKIEIQTKSKSFNHIIAGAAETGEKQRIMDVFVSPVMLALYLNLMLHSKTTEMRRVVPDAKLVKAQLKRGVTPLMFHTVVNIYPDRFIERTDKQTGKTHASPRMHWRRSHLRHFKEPPARGIAKWSPECVWRGEKGWFVVPIPRFLVGSKELGEVTHEYKIIRETSTAEKAEPRLRDVS